MTMEKPRTKKRTSAEQVKNVARAAALGTALTGAVPPSVAESPTHTITQGEEFKTYASQRLSTNIEDRRTEKMTSEDVLVSDILGSMHNRTYNHEVADAPQAEGAFHKDIERTARDLARGKNTFAYIPDTKTPTPKQSLTRRITTKIQKFFTQ